MTTPTVIANVQQGRPREQPYLVAFAVLAVLAVGMNLDLPVGHLTSTFVVAGAMAPVTVSSVFRGSRWLTWLLILAGAAVVYGFWLALRPSDRHMAMGAAVDDTLLLLTLVLGAALVFWARTILPDPWVAFTYGVGLLLRTLLTADGLALTNPWKFGFSLPLTVIGLSLAWAMKSTKLAVVLLLVLALAGALNDSRSGFALLVMTAVLLLWSHRPRNGSSKRWLGSMVLLVLAFAGMYKVAETLILDGYLGQETQVRTQLQVETNGSLFLGSRPEFGATTALMREDPSGFGVGIMPTPNDIATAKQGMTSLGRAPDENYVEKYMFGSGFELHSVTGDLWAHFGIVGLALAGFILVLAVKTVAQEISSPAARALVIYLGLRVLRDLFASPLSTSTLVWMLFLGLVGVPAVAAWRAGRQVTT